MTTTLTACSSLHTVRDAIEASGAFTRARSPDAFMASCPLHDDVNPSLSVTWKPRPHSVDGAVLLHCFSCGAQAGALAAALGLRMADLFDEPDATAATRTTRPRPTARPPLPARPARPEPQHHWKRVRVYTYTTDTGAPVQQVIRQQCCCDAEPELHKRFLQRYRTGRQWVWRKPHGFTPVLYRARQLARAGAQEWVWLTEGEKDADAAAGLGLTATTNPQGATAFAVELADGLAGRRVAIVVDRDRAGYTRGLDLHEILAGHTTQIQLLLPAPEHPKADLTDHINGGHWDPGQPFGGLIPVSIDELERIDTT